MRSSTAGGRAGPLVGRDDELARLVGAARAAADGRGQAVLVLGDAGIGKTRLLDETDRAAGADVDVAWGRGWRPDEAPALWPWAQVLRSLAATRPPGALAPSRRVASTVGRVIPELAERLDVDPLDGQPTPVEVLDALASCLVHAARHRPVLVLLDDLHDADRASRDLAGLLATQTWTAPLSVVAASRPTVASSDLSEIATRSDVLVLQGLDASGVASLAEATGVTLSGDDARLLHDQTGGNPFLVLESVVARAGPRPPRGVTAGIRALVGSRLDPLPPAMVEVLVATAVLDELADERLLATVLDRDVIEVAEDLKALADLELAHRAADRAGGWAVPHDLVREAVLARGDEARRRQLEAAVTRALAARFPRDPTRAAAIAHHAVAAIPAIDLREAVDHLRRAADHASLRLAHAEAAHHLGLAASLLRDAEDGPSDLLAVLLQLGQAQTRGAAPASARSTYGEAIDLARRLDDPEALAMAVLGSCDSQRRAPHFNFDAAQLVPALDEAAAGLAATEETPTRATLRARLLATRALHLAIAGRVDGLAEAIRDADAAAEASGADRARAQVAASRRLSLGADVPPADRRAATDLLRELADGSGDLELRYRACEFALTDALEAGDPPGAAAAVDACTGLAARMQEPYFETLALVWQGTLALLQGRFADHEAITQRAGRTTQVAEGAGSEVLGGQQLYVAREQGTLDPDGLDALVEQYPDQPVIRALRVWGHAHAGSLDRARELLDEMIAAGLDHLPRNTYWLVTVTMLAEVAARVRAREPAATILRLLAPLPDQCVVTASGPMAWAGPLRHFTGLLRLVTGDPHAAVEDLTAALGTARRMGARPFVARTGIGLAAALVFLDRRAAATQLRTAREAAAGLGMRWLVDDVDALAAEASLDLESTPRTRAGVVEARRAVLRPRGGAWEVGFEDEVVSVRGTKGMRHLHELVRRPHASIHVLDLTTALEADRPTTEPGALPVRRGGHAGAILDDEALRAYRSRLAELEDELDAADQTGDVDRARSAGAERDALLAELSSGVGFGGRPRRTADDAERARLNVTRAIRTAIDRIRAVDAVLADHLDTAVHTGRECSYAPDPTSPIAWRLGTDDDR